VAGINEATKYVVSNTLREHEWSNSVFINGDAMEEIRKLKQGDGPPLHVYGSSNLIQTLLKHDLIDELWLKIYPITLGEGSACSRMVRLLPPSPWKARRHPHRE
jgi:dihydrofolate reductase